MGEVSPLERDHSLRVVLPAGIEKNITVHGSKPVMDLLVTLCANHHLNPSDYTIEFLSPNKNIISYKPNCPIGSLGAEKILLKLKGSEDKIKKPYMPEATVRLLINYNKSHKTVVRVNPRLPLEALLPAVCDKCEFNIKTTVLLRDPQSKEPLDLTKTLNDHRLREVFAKDTGAQNASTEGAGTPEIISPPPTQDLQRKENKQKKRGFFSFFRRRKKINETNGTLSAPTSPSRGKQVRVRGNSESLSSNNTLPADTAKKRPAPPPPPIVASQSVPNNLSTCYVKRTQSSAESTLRSTKRRAPPPPCGATNDAQSDAGESLKTVEELRETENSQPHSSMASSSPSLARLQEIPDSYRPSFRGKDLSDARSALAKVLTSSVSKGTLVRRLRNSAGFPNFHVSSCMSAASKCPDDGDFCAERESVFRSNLPTENEWEDQVQRSGLTTFKVVPPKKPASCDPEMMDQDQKSVLPEGKEDPHSSSTFESRTGINCSETYANEVVDSSISGSPLEETQNCSDSPLLDDGENHEDQNQEEEPEVPLDGVLPALLDGCDKEATNHDGGHSEHLSEFDPSPDMVPLNSSTDGKSKEDFSREEAGGEEAAFPSPPPPVEFSDNMGTGEEEASFPSCGTAAPSMNGHRNASGEADDSGSSSDATEPPAGQTKVAPSRFAQAVAMAVQRSRLQRLGLGIGFGPQLSGRPNVSVPSPPRSSYQYGA
ncbi:cordon-bleu protein-like 1 isoform X2 [Cyprinodon tularosa]|uniref:cordon-bleu protein-like 1 isoform X2 n=1 Tax=Cyprinodon tularosa TaxID=77115 RepID=UPI0018E207E6|nr:cordon-bleu protein-like 1 isoform X2 [Cyprinodon tularosa]